MVKLLASLSLCQVITSQLLFQCHLLGTTLTRTIKPHKLIIYLTRAIDYRIVHVLRFLHGQFQVVNVIVKFLL